MRPVQTLVFCVFSRVKEKCVDIDWHGHEEQTMRDEKVAKLLGINVSYLCVF